MRGVIFAICASLFLLPTHATISPNMVHAFFYLWYGNPATDGKYQHWSHAVIPHWDESVQRRYDDVKDLVYQPPHEPHSPYFPARGLYSSKDGNVLREQMKELADHGVGVVVVSWWGRPSVPKTHDGQGVNSDGAIRGVLDAAATAGVKVAFHLEPYEGRSASSIRDDLEYIHKNYGSHPAVFKTTRTDLGGFYQEDDVEEKERLLVYIYDSYHVSLEEWMSLLDEKGSMTIRGTELDVVAIGLLTDERDAGSFPLVGFDGGYTYFASPQGGTRAARPALWGRIAKAAEESGMAFIPSVGPGYDDTKIRPWNTRSTVDREGGWTYVETWRRAASVTTGAISITSANEWGEGTQIEPAKEHHVPPGQGIADEHRAKLHASRSFPQYEAAPDLPRGLGNTSPNPNLYLQLTKVLATWTDEDEQSYLAHKEEENGRDDL